MEVYSVSNLPQTDITTKSTPGLYVLNPVDSHYTSGSRLHEEGGRRESRELEV